MDYIKENNRIYSLDENDKLLAEVKFPNEGNVFTITRTFVDDSLAGQGIAGKLVSMAVDSIKDQDGEIAATCSYAQHWLEKNGYDIPESPASCGL